MKEDFASFLRFLWEIDWKIADVLPAVSLFGKNVYGGVLGKRSVFWLERAAGRSIYFPLTL